MRCVAEMEATLGGLVLDEGKTEFVGEDCIYTNHRMHEAV